MTANVTAGNVYANSGTVGASLLTGTLTTAAQPNVTSVGTLGNLSVTANVTAGNVYANSGTIGASLLAGTLTTAAQPNVTSVGTLTGLGVNGNITAANITANTGVFTGNAAGLTNIPGGNVSGAVASATTAGTVTTAAQPNITSVGTLSSLSVSGNLSSGNANLGNLARANFFQGDGSLLTNISVGAGSFIANGNSNVSVTSANGNVAISAVGNANIVVVTGTGANINGTANVSGNLSAGNISATSIAGNLTTAAQTNITSLGTLTGLNVNGTSNLGPNSNVIITGGVANAFLRTDGSGNLSWDTATLVPAQGSNTQVIFNDGGTVYAGSNALTFNKTSNVLTLGGNLSVGNISGANNVISNFFTGTLRTNAQPNITSVGTLASLNVNNTITAVAFTANTGVFTGNGSGLSAIAGANVTGTVANATFATSAGSATTAGTVTTAAQPNITSVGTLTGLTVDGNITVGNISGANNVISNFFTGTLRTNAQPNITSVGTLTGLGVNGNITAANITANTGVFTGNGSGLSAIAGANVTGTVSSAATATNATAVLTNTSTATTVYLTGTSTAANAHASLEKVTGIFANMSNNSITATTFVGALSGAATSATTAGTVTTAAQPNITSVGTLTSLGVNGTITAVNITANTGVFTGNGSGLSAIAGANVTGTVSSATTAGTVTTAAQPNITSVGTLTSLGVNGTVTAVNFTANTGVFAGSGANLTTLNASNISSGTLAQARLANASVTLGSTALTLGGTVTTVAGLTSVTSTTFVGSLSGAATTAGTVTTAAQPNITSVGTLTGLDVNGNITAANITANTGVFTGNGSGLSALNASNISTGTLAQARLANASVTLGSTALTLGSTVTTVAGLSSVTSTTFVGSLSGAATTAGTVTTAAQPNITSVGTLANLTAGAITINGTTGLPAQISGQPVITGSLGSPNIGALYIGDGTGWQFKFRSRIGSVDTDRVTFFDNGNVTLNTGVITGNGSGLSAIAGANVTGAVAFATTANAVAGANVSGTVSSATTATTAGTVTTAAQPNITSTGTLTSLTVSGNVTAQANVNMTGFVIRSVSTGIAAAGSNQGTATAITREMNVVSTVASGAGVILPTAVAGMVVSITNTSANSLLVYPHSGGDINGAATNVAFTHTAGATLQYIAPTTSDWYTVGATYA